MPQLRERSRPDAVERLRKSLALEEIAKRESITLEQEEIEAKLKELMEQLAGQDVDPKRARQFIESDLLKEKAIKWLEEHGTIELVPKGSLTPEEDTEDVTDAAAQTIDVPAEPSAEQQTEAATTQTIDVQAQPSTEE
jgi:trigger factor